MFFRRISPRIGLVVAGCLLAVAFGLFRPMIGPGAAQPAARANANNTNAAVVIPDFWDPRRRVERPPPGTVQALRFITTDDFPPFNFLDADGHLTGFNVDLARAICTE